MTGMLFDCKKGIVNKLSKGAEEEHKTGTLKNNEKLPS